VPENDEEEILDEYRAILTGNPTMTDPHLRFRSLAAEYLAEVLPPDESAWMDSHLEECADCAVLLQRVRTRLPGLAHDAGHLPVSILDRWLHSPDEFTPFERELVERHLARCERCREWGATGTAGDSPSEIEDAVQEVSRLMVKFVRLHGPPRRLDGLVALLARRVAAEKIAQRRRKRMLDEEEEILEEHRAILAFAFEYLRLKRSDCIPIAEALARGETLNACAERQNLSFDQVRKKWSRCAKLIHEAMRNKRLRLPSPTPLRLR
jgi:hypothetical protein